MCTFSASRVPEPKTLNLKTQRRPGGSVCWGLSGSLTTAVGANGNTEEGQARGFGLNRPTKDPESVRSGENHCVKENTETRRKTKREKERDRP